MMKLTKRMKEKQKWGYRLIKCPICHTQTFLYCSWSEYGWGTVEQHGYCERCGYIVEQAYSEVYDAFWDIKKGFKHPDYGYRPKNVKRHKRIRRRLGIKNIEVNPQWIYYV
jgi:hypothetical protein